jgi:valyl-tRNA synthetase
MATSNGEHEITTKDSRQVFLDGLGGESKLNDDLLFKYGYPANTMTCASEIFNIWICRMIMLGYHFTDKAPFENVFIHAVVRDEKGRKMSKSLGNGIDPTEMIQKYSADGLRMSLNSLIVPGRDALMSKKSAEELIVKWRNFGNKLWNISRFLYDNDTFGNSDKTIDHSATTQDVISTISSASAWILEKLSNLDENIAQNMSEYRLGQVMDDIYHFVWDDFADWYIEYLKTSPDQLPFAKKHVFEPLIKLIHPFIPFETEAIWTEISKLDTSINPNNKLLVQQQFQLENIDTNQLNSSEFESIISFVTEFRKLRGLYRIDPVLKIKITSQSLLLKQYSNFVKQVARLELAENKLETTNKDDFTQKWSGIEFSFDLKNVIPDLVLELGRTKDDLEKAQKEISKLENLLNNSGFISKASQETVEKTKTELRMKLEQKHGFESKIQWIGSKI